MPEPRSDLENNDPHLNYIEINRRAYDLLSDEYSKRFATKSIFETPATHLVDRVLQHKTGSRDLSVLEIGPGSGEAVKHFEAMSCRTTAVDLSDKVIKLAKINSPNTIFIHSNILDINFYENQFDVIFAGALIHLFPKVDAEELMKKISTWIKKDGIFFVSTTINGKSEEGVFRKTDYLNSVVRFRKRWTEVEFKEFVTQNFAIIETIYTNERDRGKVWIGYICKLGL